MNSYCTKCNEWMDVTYCGHANICRVCWWQFVWSSRDPKDYTVNNISSNYKLYVELINMEYDDLAVKLINDWASTCEH